MMVLYRNYHPKVILSFKLVLSRNSLLHYIDPCNPNGTLLWCIEPPYLKICVTPEWSEWIMSDMINDDIKCIPPFFIINNQYFHDTAYARRRSFRPFQENKYFDGPSGYQWRSTRFKQLAYLPTNPVHMECFASKSNLANCITFLGSMNKKIRAKKHQMEEQERREREAMR